MGRAAVEGRHVGGCVVVKRLAPDGQNRFIGGPDCSFLSCMTGACVINEVIRGVWLSLVLFSDCVRPGSYCLSVGSGGTLGAR